MSSEHGGSTEERSAARDGGSRRRGPRRASIVVRYGEREYERDLVRCRRELLQREMEGTFGSVPELAQKAGLSRSTVSGFFSGGRSASRPTVVRILRELGLTFDDVHQEIARERRARTGTSPQTFP